MFEINKEEDMNVVIDENFCFKSSGFTIKEAQDALAYYCRQKKVTALSDFGKNRLMR